jgi:hypothetical protein
VLREVWDYIRFDRAELIEQARRRGTYGELTGKSLVEDPHHAAIAPRAGGDRRRPVETLNPRQRRRPPHQTLPGGRGAPVGVSGSFPLAFLSLCENVGAAVCW